MSGYFITFEGGEGAGKTTVLQVAAKALENQGYDVLSTREPGGIDIAEEIRNIILDPANTKMKKRTEALLFAAARHQHLTEKVLPALAAGKIVLCDRFIDSSLAYQGYAQGLGIDQVFSINQFAIQDAMPDLTLFFDIAPKKGLDRIAANKDRERNRLDMETIQFHERVYNAYHILLKRFPNRMHAVNADQPMEAVAEDALKQIISHLKM